MAVQIQMRRDTSADWTSDNPTLAQGEWGLETDTDNFKIGDGATAWNSLAYEVKPYSVVFGLIQAASVGAIAAASVGSNAYALTVAQAASVNAVIVSESFAITTAASVKALSLQSANNLSDVANAGTSRSNIHVPILAACQTVASASVSLSSPGAGPWNGASVTVGGQILLTAQTTASQNGPYVYNGASVSLTRPTDYATGASVGSRTMQISAGTYANTEWMMSTTSTVIVDTTATTWTLGYSGTSVPTGQGATPIQITTTSDLSTQVLTASTPPGFAAISATGPSDVIVQPGETFQEFLGCGGAITDATAYVLWNYMTPTQRTAILTEMFSPSQANFSTIRIAMGWQSFSNVSLANAYTYDDVPSGQTDPNLLNFSIAKDTAYIIPVLQAILAVNPNVRIIATPWSCPVWMMSSGAIGVGYAVFNTAYYQQYANYFVKFIQAYQALGIPIWAVTPTNEPCGGDNLPFTASQEATFVGTYLGPTIAAAGLTTKILIGDDSWGTSGGLSVPTYVNTVLGTAAAQPYIGGVAWHGYTGSPDAMAPIQKQYPAYGHHATEWRSLASESANTQMSTWAGGFVGQGTRYGAQSLTTWNLALDQNGNPFQGTGQRLGVIAVNNSTGAVTRNAAYYALRQLSQFLQPGALRVASSSFGSIYQADIPVNGIVSTAFINPDSSVVLYLFNGTGATQTFQIIDGQRGLASPVTMVAGQLSTVIWNTRVLLNPVTAVPAAPSAPVLTATGQAGQIALSWTTPASAAPISYYQINRGSTSGTEIALVQVPVGTNAYVNLLGGASTEYYTVQAVSAGGSATSTEQSATSTAAAAPTAPVISAVAGAASNTISWTIPNGNGSLVTSYELSRGTTSGGETNLVSIGQGNTSYTDVGLTPGTTYYYKLTATNTTGTSSASNEVSGVPTTAWTYESAVSSAASSLTTTVVTTGATSIVGDLMILTWGGTRTSAFTSAAPTDTGSGGWTSISPGFQTRSNLTSQSWWKIATSADASVTVTVTGSGGSGTVDVGIECDVFRLPSGFTALGPDIFGGATPTSTTSTTWHPSAGSSSPTFTDALAYAVAVSAVNRGAITGTNTFTGTSSPATLAPCFASGSFNFVDGQYVGAVQASATSASNTWALGWTNSVGPNVLGATFTYTP